MTARDALRTLVAALPADGAATVPCAWLRELLGDQPPADPDSTRVDVDLTVAGLARLLGRAEPTVRAWVAAGLFPGAWRLGREWRVPAAGVMAFQERERRQAAAGNGTRIPGV